MPIALSHRFIALLVLTVLASLLFVVAAPALSIPYSFNHVPPTGWTISDDKVLSSGSALRTTVSSITGYPQIEAEKGVLFRGVNKVTGGTWDVSTGITAVQKQVIPSASTKRTVYVKLQTLGKTIGYTIVTGGWYYY